MANLQADRRANLVHLANVGDTFAKEALYLEGTGRAGVFTVGPVAAKSATNIAASSFGDTAAGTAITVAASPDVPRNLRATFGAAWDTGNDIVVIGVDQFGAAVTETLVAVASSIVVGAKIFKTVTSITHKTLGVGSHATNTVTMGTGDKLGLPVTLANAVGVGFSAAGVGEAVTLDTTYEAVTFTTVPSATTFTLLCNF